MAITTLSGMSQGATQQFSFTKGQTTSSAATFPTFTWFLSGSPSQGAGGGTLSGQTVSSSTTGTLPYKNPPSGETYLSKLDMPGTLNHAASFVQVVDLLWLSSNVSQVTTTQTINSVAFPSRDLNGSSNGAGVYIGMYVSTTYSSPISAYTATISYTNSDNVSGRTGAYSRAAVQDLSTRFFIFGLDSGDVGVRSIQSFTFSALPGVSGNSLLFAFRPIATVSMGLSRGGTIQRESAVSLGAPRLYDSTALSFFLYGSPSLGTITLSQG